MFHLLSKAMLPLPFLIVATLSVATDAATSTSKSNHTVSGRAAVAAVRHDWKKQTLSTVHFKVSSATRLPANFGRLSAEARLAVLHQIRNLNPNRFDQKNPNVGALLAADDRIRAAQASGNQTMNGLLPDTALTRYLQYRRSLNSVRFDRFHPVLGAILAEDQKLRNGTGTIATEITPPPVISIPPGGSPAGGPPVGGGGLPIRPVPEPTSLILMATGVIVALIVSIVRSRKRHFVASI